MAPKLPSVSICTPTYNRSYFIEAWASCIFAQDYPRELIEVIVADDGSDDTESEIRRLEHKLPNLRILKYSKKNNNSIKRQWIAERADGEILVHFDDDDYYFPTRVSSAVRALNGAEEQIAGHSELYLWHTADEVMTRMPPFHSKHACCGSFAYKREYLLNHAFKDVPSGPEPWFTNNFREPMIQLNPLSSMICIAHSNNTVKKRKDNILKGVHIRDYVKDKALQSFYESLKLNR